MYKQRVKAYIKQQTQWYIEGLISEENLRFKIDDCKENYPDEDYEQILGEINQELKAEVEALKNEN